MVRPPTEACRAPCRRQVPRRPRKQRARPAGPARADLQGRLRPARASVPDPATVSNARHSRLRSPITTCPCRWPAYPPECRPSPPCPLRSTLTTSSAPLRLGLPSTRSPGTSSAPPARSLVLGYGNITPRGIDDAMAVLLLRDRSNPSALAPWTDDRGVAGEPELDVASLPGLLGCGWFEELFGVLR